MDVRLPDGTIIRNVPDGTTKADLVSKLQANGMNVPADWLPAAGGPAPSGFMKGLNDIASGGAQMLTHALPSGVVDAVNSATSKVNALPVIGPVTRALGMVPATPQEIDQQITDTGSAYDKARAAAGKTGIDWSRGAGQVVGAAPLAGVLPAAGPSLAGRAAVGALAGGVGALSQPVENAGDDFALKKGLQVGTGTLLGSVLTPVLGKVVDKVSQGVANFFANRKPVSMADVEGAVREQVAAAGARWEDLSNSVQDELRSRALAALQVGSKGIDRQAALRAQDFAAEQMQPTLGQVTRDAGQFASERNLRTMPGVGDPLLARFQQQGNQLQSKIGAFAQGAAGDSSVASNKLADALKTYDASKSAEVTAAYNAFRNAGGTDIPVPLQPVAQRFGEVLDTFGKENVPSAVISKLEGMGLLGGKQTKVFDLMEADKLIKVINANYDPMKPQANAAMAGIRKGLQEAIDQANANSEGATGPASDLLKKAISTAKARFDLHDAVPALEAASKGTAPPDDFVRRFVLNGQPTDVKKLADVLKTASPDAYNEARAQLGLKLQKAAFGEDVVGDAAFNPKQFAKALSQVTDTKLSAFFTDAEIAQLHRLSRVGSYINQAPNASPVQSSNNWGAIMNLASRVPGVPMIVNVAKAASTAVGNQSAVSNALKAQIPAVPAEIDPATARALSRALSGAAGAAGMAAADNSK